MSKNHQEHINFIWTIANLLRGPYRPAQYRRVMLSMTVLRRMDCVLEPTKEKVLQKYQTLKAIKVKNPELILNRVAKETFYNISNYTFQKLIGDLDNITRNLQNYIKGFSSKAREVFEYYNFEQEIAKLEESNRLFLMRCFMECPQPMEPALIALKQFP
jgi:type I restriction enzyme M protein